MTAPLFLLAPPRSFTSVINAMLGQHPQMYGMPELNLFNVEKLKHLWRKVFDRMGERHGILRAVAEIYGGEQTSETIVMAAHWAAAREDLDTGEVYRELADKIDPLIPVEKSPSYTFSIYRLMRIFETFPDARFLHLIRHPITQSRSIMNISGGTFALVVNAIEFDHHNAIIEPQIAWHDLNINILNFLEMVPEEQQMRIRGEELMALPQIYLGDVCRWLGIRDDAEAMEEMMHPERSPFACFGPITALFGNDPNFLKKPSLRLPFRPDLPSLDDPVPWRDDGCGLRPEVVSLAREFGYT